MIREARYYVDMAVGFYRLLRQPPVGNPREVLRSQIARREDSFLYMARMVVFANPRNPYREMFRLASCGYSDLEAAVRREGLDRTLGRLAEAGVYLTYDEFQGKTAIIRGGRHIASHEDSFVNPLVRGDLETRSGGSRSRGTMTRQNTRDQVHWDTYWVLWEDELGLPGRARVQLQPILPSGAGITACIQYARRRVQVSRWFSAPGTIRDSGHYRIVTQTLILLARALGARVPTPHYLPPNDFSPVAQWLARLRDRGQSSAVTAYVSPAVRVAAAAKALELDIRGTLFLVSGEALTESKRRMIEATGSEVFPFYWIQELGPIGFACRQMRSGNCVHLVCDSMAVTKRRRRAPLSEVELDSLLFTSLLPFAPRFLINAEMDDTGVIEPAGCDCVFSRLGMTTQIRDIASYGKLTGQGITLYGTDVVEILEVALPARFGGAPGDYQLVESESPDQTRLVLRVSPRVGVDSVETVKQFFVEEVQRRYGGALAARIWRHANAVEVVIAEPYVTMAGKVLPLHLLGSGITGNNPS